jgi:hypothetical protein
MAQPRPRPDQGTLGGIAAAGYRSIARIIHENFYCNRQLHAISIRARSLRFDVLQVRLQGNSLRLA